MESEAYFMEIRQIVGDQSAYLPLLLLGDEQEDMIARYLDRSALFTLWDGGAEIALVGSAAITLTQDTLYTEEGKTIPVADLAPGNMLRVSGEAPNVVYFGADTLRQPVYLTYAADAMPTSQTLIAGPDETINITP